MEKIKKESKRLLVFAILDGWGAGSKDKKINALEAAKTPFFDYLIKNYPHTQLDATGRAVGLEENQMSGSEAGHLNIGAGRIVKQDVRIILEEINQGNFFKNPVFLSAIQKIKEKNSDMHLMGLMGNNDSPHSHPDIFLALLVLLEKHNLKGKVYIHLFTDGRDSFPKSALEHWKKWKGMLDTVGAGKLASVTGRFYAMDRAKNWDRLISAYDALVNGEGKQMENFKQVIEYNYKQGNTDEYVEPSVIVDKNKKPTAVIKENDGLIFFNLRSDRARQFSKLFVGANTRVEKNFPKVDFFKKLSFVAMTDFGPDLNLQTAYSVPPIKGTLPSLLSNLKQLYISETEKFAHITYFINGGYPDPVGGEDRIMVKSPKVRSYAEKPEMASKEITKVIKDNLKYGVYNFIAVNYPNTDMVGHTGDFQATMKAAEIIDQRLKSLYKEIKKKNGALVVTADHGNADVMLDQASGRIFTFHTKNPVPFIVADDKLKKKINLKSGGKLANVAPTLLDILNIYPPEEITEQSLIEK